MEEICRHIAFLLLMPLLLFVSCIQEIDDNPGIEDNNSPGIVHYRATVSSRMPTRASVNNIKQYVFELGDEIYVTHTENSEVVMYGFLSLVAGEGATTATFEGDLMCIGDYSPEADHVLSGTLVGVDDRLFSRMNGKLTGPSYPTDEFAGSFEDAVRKFSVFTGDSTCGEHSFTLEQNSTFLILSVFLSGELAENDEIDAVISATKSDDSQLELSSTVKIKELSLTPHAGFAVALPGGTSLKAASVTLSRSGSVLYSSDIDNDGDDSTPFTLAKNTYYNIERTQINPDALEYFTIQASEDGTVIKPNYSIQYRKNSMTDSFVDYSGSEGIPLGQGDYIQVRRIGTTCSDGTNTLFSEDNHKLCYIYGDLRTLVCNSDYSKRTTYNASAFKSLFINTDYIDIPSGRPLRLSEDITSIGNYCFQNMFQGCTSLTNPPQFSNVNISTSGCQSMFEGCTSLLSASELPATSVAASGYKYMFKGCTSLITGPSELKGTSGDNSCESMFEGCTSIVLAPDLPSASVGSSGYKTMFYGCTSLLSSPELGATSIGTSAYYSMFQGCTALISGPSILPAPLKNSCYRNMFSGCSSLTSVPALPATNDDNVNQCYYAMFQGCTSLNTAQATLGLTKIGVSGCYKMFYGCALLVTAPEMPYVTSVGQQGCQEMFASCGELVTGPSALTASAPEGANCYNAMFKNCIKLLATPEICASSLPQSACKQMFSGCTRLETITGFLPSSGSANVYESMFYNCKALTTAPTLTATELGNACYKSMFEGSGITKAPDLPVTTLTQECYMAMFRNCKSLEGPVCLPAPSLVRDCYDEMFNGATKLNYVICLANDLGTGDGVLGTSLNTDNWLKSVSNTGTFRYAVGYGLSSNEGIWDTGDSGIPTNWIIRVYGLDPVFPANPFDPEEDL